MTNTLELHAREIFEPCPEISILYQEFLNDLERTSYITERKIVSLRYNKKANQENSLTIDSNMYILHNGNVAILRNNNDCTTQSNIPYIALQYINTPGFVINPYSLVQLDYIEEPLDSIYPLATSNILTLPHEAALELFISNTTFKKIILQSCMHEESLLQQQIQIRQTKQGILPLFATYLLCRQRNGQITVSNKDLGRLFGIGDKRIQSLKRELFEKGIIAIKDAKDTLEIKDMETLQYMANDY